MLLILKKVVLEITVIMYVDDLLIYCPSAHCDTLLLVRMHRAEGADAQNLHTRLRGIAKGCAKMKRDPSVFLGLTPGFHSCLFALLCLAVHCCLLLLDEI